MMNSKQIDELNALLVDNAECLTAFYDEGIRHGAIKGFGVGIIISVIGFGIVYGSNKLISRINKKEES